MDFNKFQINIKDLKISNSEDSISKTIEELLSLNDKIPSRWENDKDITMLTNRQFDESSHSNLKDNRGEQRKLYEKQLEQRRTNKKLPVQEEQFLEKGKDGGHREEKENNESIRGHKKKNIQPIWHEVYNLEDARKDDKSLENKIDVEKEK